MSDFKLFDTLPEGFKLAKEEDLPLVTLTLAQAFADYKYPIPSIEISHSALLRFYYELSLTCAENALENGCILTNDDFSAVMLITPFEKRANYGPEALYENLKKNDSIESADNMLAIFDYIGEGEAMVKLDGETIFIDQFAVQTPKQGQKLGSKLMRELFNQCDKKNIDVFLYTNTEKNKDIYNHFGFETVSTIHKDEINSDTYYLVWKSPKKRLEELKNSVKITSCYPMYYSKRENFETIINLFDDLGINRLHHFKHNDEFEGYVLGNDNGSKIDVFTNKGIEDLEGLYGLRLNVDSLDAAISFAKNNGYKILSDIIEDKHSRSIFTKSVCGMNCYFIEHIKSKEVTSIESIKEVIEK